MKRVKVKVYGLVHGVFYRYSAKEIANKLAIHGWCKNEEDGTVLLVVEGEAENIDEFIKWCHQGSPLAKVEKVEIDEEEYKGDMGDFEIK